jgi:CBS domain containing-hemolysin-like protein
MRDFARKWQRVGNHCRKGGKMSLLFPLIVIIFLILLNGLFVAAEFAIIGVRPSRLEQLSAEGNETAREVHTILRNPGRVDRYIATAQLGITLASLGLGMYAEPQIAHLIEGPLESWFHLEEALLHTIGFILALSIITYLHVVVGEMVPKSLALQSSEKTVLALNGPMTLFRKVFLIPVRVLNWIGLLVLRLFRVPPPAHGAGFSAEELELIVSESHAGGLLNEQEQEMVANVFDFSKRRVAEVMTPRTRISAIPITTTEQQLLDLLEEPFYNRLPVYKGSVDSIIGILHIKDFIRQQNTGTPFDLRALLRQVPFVPETLLIKQLLAVFRLQNPQIAIVVDEHGGTVGLVTLEDLIEEVFGEVRDEFDPPEEQPLVEVAPGELLARGDVIIDEIQDYVNLGDHEHDVYTIGGLVTAELGHLGVVGEEVVIGDARILVEAVDGLSIQRVSIRFKPNKEED